MKVIQVFRRTNPEFFSIENVFQRVNNSIGGGVSIMPFYLKDFGISFSNIFSLVRMRLINSDALFHVTGDVHYAVLFLPRDKTILTIHDCVFIRQHKGIKKALIKWLYLDLPVKYCKNITTISGKSKMEIMALTKCSGEKITVISNPVSNDIVFVDKNFNSNDPSILFIGITENKNLRRAAQALIGIDCCLTIIGKLNYSAMEYLKASKIKFEQKFSLSDDDMAEVYRKTDVVLFPSLYEGFGLPIIEGFQAGRVVVTSDISPMREIADGAACLVNPEDINSIRAGVISVIQNQSYREALVKRGLEVAKKYSSEYIAGLYLSLYKTLFDRKCVG